mmetsp:Transcript_34212/g.82830  ORF Transcript_34212/g.82830 Transcript_34212/m.82830 type:complete len:94 (-) Transcript_34212:97-378(-)
MVGPRATTPDPTFPEEVERTQTPMTRRALRATEAIRPTRLISIVKLGLWWIREEIAEGKEERVKRRGEGGGGGVAHYLSDLHSVRMPTTVRRA